MVRRRPKAGGKALAAVSGDGQREVKHHAGVRSVIRQYILSQIHNGDWTVGSKLPTEMALAERFETSRSNANQAIKVLEAEGVVRRYRRKGTFVARALSTAASPRMGKQHQPAQGCVQIITPLGCDDAAMQWKHAALGQIESSLNQAGMRAAHLSLVNHPTVEAFAHVLETARREPAQGLIILTDLLPANVQHDHETELLPFTKLLLSNPIPTCWLNHAGMPLVGWPFDAVSLSPFDEGAAVGQYLREQGVSQVLCLVREDVHWGRMRKAGLEVMASSAPRPMHLETRSLEASSDHNALFNDVLDQVQARQATDLPLTIVPPNDVYAAQLLQLAAKRGIRCPQQFCIVSFGNDNRFRDHNITTVAPQASQMGEVISQLITHQIRRPAGAAVHMTLKSIIIERLTFALPNQHSA